ncbi:MAG: methyltransferase domain-containing protein [Ktedonobacteraceae bacterium]|nr:methyltransferase domain-containing protein [Ktedonobacteraceae bacterium]
MVTTHSAAAYDAIAEWYYRELSASWIHQTALPALLDLVREEMRGQQRVCDIGCGTGILSRALAREGAIVVGIDLSSRLLQFAQEEETARPLGITYLPAGRRSRAALVWRSPSYGGIQPGTARYGGSLGSSTDHLMLTPARRYPGLFHSASLWSV